MSCAVVLGPCGRGFGRSPRAHIIRSYDRPDYAVDGYSTARASCGRGRCDGARRTCTWRESTAMLRWLLAVLPAAGFSSLVPSTAHSSEAHVYVAPMSIMSMYGGTSEDLRGIVNVKRGGVHDCSTNATLLKYFGYKVLLDLDHTVFDLYKKRLHGSWEAIVDGFAQQAKPCIANGTAVGVFIADEICCSYGISYQNLSSVASRLKARLPSAWITTNECWNINTWPALTSDGEGGIPPGLDAISADVYDMNTPPERPPNSNGTANAYKNIKFFENEVFPRLRPNQMALLAPGVFASSPAHCRASNISCPLATQAEQVVARLDVLFNWSKQQHKIAGWIPWHFENRSTPQWGGAYNLELGAIAMPSVVSKLREVGAFVQSHKPPARSVPIP